MSLATASRAGSKYAPASSTDLQIVGSAKPKPRPPTPGSAAADDPSVSAPPAAHTRKIPPIDHPDPAWQITPCLQFHGITCHPPSRAEFFSGLLARIRLGARARPGTARPQAKGLASRGLAARSRDPSSGLDLYRFLVERRPHSTKTVAQILETTRFTKCQSIYRRCSHGDALQSQLFSFVLKDERLRTNARPLPGRKPWEYERRLYPIPVKLLSRAACWRIV